MIHARAIDRGLQALPLALATWLVALVSDTPVPPAVLALALAAGLAVGGRLDVEPATQWVLAALSAAVGAVGMATLAPTGDAAGRIDRFWSVIAAAALCAAASRLFVRAPHGGARVTVALGFAAVAVGGETRVQAPYGVFVAAWMVTALAALRLDDPDRPGLSRAAHGSVGAAGLILAVAALLSVGASRVLPPLHARAVEIILGRITPADAVTGFTGNLDLSGLDGMLQSDTVVLRVYGPADDYLRGAVYDRYDRAGWRSMRGGETRSIETATGPLRGNRAVEVRRVGGLAGRFFLPLGVETLATVRGVADADPHGIIHVASGDPGDVVWYLPGTRRELAPAPPDPNDLRVPADVHAALAPVVADWTAGATGPAHVVAALTLHLRRDFHYSLYAPHARRRDPVVEFVLGHRRGDCEYFASALALLCRTAGIPARVVGGYRVSERNDFGGYLVVRERNAHTWVEVWQAGHGWQTIDATPGGGETRVQNAGTWRALSDFSAALADAAGAWIARRRPIDLLAAAGAAAALFGLVRWLRTRRARGSVLAAVGDAPLPAYAGLARALARRGLARAVAEPLEHYAARVAEALPGEPGTTTAEAIRAYAALRYGAQGDADTVTRSLDRSAAEVGGRPRGP